MNKTNTISGDLPTLIGLVEKLNFFVAFYQEMIKVFTVL